MFTNIMALVIGMKEIAYYCNKILQLSQNSCNKIRLWYMSA